MRSSGKRRADPSAMLSASPLHRGGRPQLSTRIHLPDPIYTLLSSSRSAQLIDEVIVRLHLLHSIHFISDGGGI